MNTFAVVVLAVAVCSSAQAGHLGLGLGGGWGGLGGGWGGWGGWAGHGAAVAPIAIAAPVNPAAHIPSGSVSVGHNGAVIAGPSGSVRTDNGLSGHGAGAVLAGPAGDVATQGGHARLAGPGLIGGHVAAAPVAVAWGPGAGWAGAGHGWAGHGLLGGHGHGW